MNDTTIPDEFAREGRMIGEQSAAAVGADGAVIGLAGGFFTGLHQPSDGKHFDAACISIKRLLVRRKPIGCPRVMVDSGAFTELFLHGKYRDTVARYAAQLGRLVRQSVASIVAAVAQDYMCEPIMLAKTKATGASDGTIEDHQRLTVERFDALQAALRQEFGGDPPFHVMPVLQGFEPEDYVRHIAMYGARLTHGMWVGVGSVCKRQGNINLIVAVLRAIKAVRRDLRLHGFGVKLTALKSRTVRALLYTADSMAWSYSARRQGRSANDWREAAAFAVKIFDAQPQPDLFDALELT